MICEEIIHSPSSSLNDLSDTTSSSDSIPSQQSFAFEDLTIVQKLNKAKFPVFLSFSPSLNQYFATKVFPYNEGAISPYFANEAQFAVLDHINVISIVHYEVEREAVVEDSTGKISYIVMELAPFGDFFDVIMTHKIQFDEKLARTYFHQLIEGLEYLHQTGVAHLDLKLENLLLGNNHVLKIADFDQAHVLSQETVFTKGTVCYRSPELIRGQCKDAKAADIYSAGVLLFLFKSGGTLPHSEHQKYKGLDLFNMVSTNNRMFWEKHCQIQGREPEFFDKDFKALFNAMVSSNPGDRPSVDQIKKSKWYKKAIYSQEEVSYIMNQCLA